jgi:4-diphosphocytidyl-2-C-methyl-D-erythritol kinase
MLESSAVPAGSQGQISSLTIRAAAKVNLVLEVLGKREDGYHELSTVLQAVSLFDDIRLEATPTKISLSSAGVSVPEDSTNLAWRAATLLQEEFRVDRGVSITLRKRTPVAAGLGGGSSNAAAVLWGLNILWSLNRDEECLQGLAAKLGMDVPFFLSGGTALATGRGEKLAPLKSTGALTMVLVNPNFALSTREVYGMVAVTLRGDGNRTRALVRALETGDPEEVAQTLYNDLEGVVQARYPVIGEIKRALLQAGALGTVLSGSGPTVMGLARSDPHARQIGQGLEGRPWSHWIVEGLKERAVIVERRDG